MVTSLLLVFSHLDDLLHFVKIMNWTAFLGSPPLRKTVSPHIGLCGANSVWLSRFILFLSCVSCQAICISFFQIPYYQGELITFDVVPSKLTFSVNYKSVVLKVRNEYYGIYKYRS